MRLLILILFLLFAQCRAATVIWDGGGANDNWGQNQNWNPNSDPAIGSDIRLDGAARLTNYITGAGLTSNYSDIVFNSGAGKFQVIGGSVAIGSAGISNWSANAQTFISNNINFTANSYISATSNSLNFIDGQIILGSNNLTISGTNTVSISKITGLGNNILTVNQSTLLLNSSNAINDATLDLVLDGSKIMIENKSQSIGTLTLKNDSYIVLGNDGIRNDIWFDSSLWQGGTLYISNWVGSSDSGGSDDRIFFTSDPNDLLGHVQFIGFEYGSVWDSITHELKVVPEPDTYFVGIVLFIVLFGVGSRVNVIR